MSVCLYKNICQKGFCFQPRFWIPEWLCDFSSERTKGKRFPNVSRPDEYPFQRTGSSEYAMLMFWAATANRDDDDEKDDKDDYNPKDHRSGVTTPNGKQKQRSLLPSLSLSLSLFVNRLIDGPSQLQAQIHAQAHSKHDRHQGARQDASIVGSHSWRQGPRKGTVIGRPHDSGGFGGWCGPVSGDLHHQPVVGQWQHRHQGRIVLDGCLQGSVPAKAFRRALGRWQRRDGRQGGGLDGAGHQHARSCFRIW